MKHKFITKKQIKRKRNNIYIITMILIGVIISYQRLENSNYKIKDKEFIELIKENTFTSKEESIINTLITKTIKKQNIVKKMTQDYQKYVKSDDKKPVIEEDISPIIYLYNSHQSEEYAPSNYIEFSIQPTVIINDYILEDIFNKNGYKTIVEESSIKEILNENKWNYANSYKASRILLEQNIQKYPSLKYFIDIHRDSLKKEKTTINIDNKDYATILFIIGLENPNYQKNLELTEKIHKKINELYPNLSKGIYKKSGVGVNGVYNQDFSENTILIEIGGEENTTNEVLNSSLAFAKSFLEVINE